MTKDGRPSDAKSYMFVYRTSEHCKEKPAILYQYGKTRSKSNIQKFLEGFSGILVSDAFSGYKSLDRNDENIHSAFCWAHARRDYADVLKAIKGEDKNYAHETVAPFKARAEKGELVSISEIKAAYRQAVGHSIGTSQIYYVLHRHGWRKVMPRSRHPKKASEEVIETSKKIKPPSMN